MLMQSQGVKIQFNPCLLLLLLLGGGGEEGGIVSKYLLQLRWWYFHLDMCEINTSFLLRSLFTKFT